jgi:hypothetical protein
LSQESADRNQQTGDKKKDKRPKKKDKRIYPPFRGGEPTFSNP